MGNSITPFSKDSTARKPERIVQSEMSQQDTAGAWGTASIPQKLIRLVGCYDPNARLLAKSRIFRKRFVSEIAK